MRIEMIMLSIFIICGIMPSALSADVGSGVGIQMQTEKFAPQIWMCGDRVVYDDNVESGRVANPVLVERIENYAFEGEKIYWQVLVMDKNGIEKIKDVYATVGPTRGTGNDIESNCRRVNGQNTILSTCNARILEQQLTKFDPAVMAYYDCTFTVETPNSMHGEYFVTVEVEDLDGLQSIMKESEYWFLNPDVALRIDGSIDFGTVRPGAVSYSDSILIGNDAETGSGVLLDMFVSGTDFYDPASSGAKCPTTNQLKLGNFRYYASCGAYTTQRVDPGKTCTDAEGYSSVNYGNKITQAKEVIGCRKYNDGTAYQPGNVLTPGAEMALTFKLELPEPCNGDFSDGNIFFWGEAV